MDHQDDEHYYLQNNHQEIEAANGELWTESVRPHLAVVFFPRLSACLCARVVLLASVATSSAVVVVDIVETVDWHLYLVISMTLNLKL